MLELLDELMWILDLIDGWNGYLCDVCFFLLYVGSDEVEEVMDRTG